MRPATGRGFWRLPAGEKTDKEADFHTIPESACRAESGLASNRLSIVNSRRESPQPVHNSSHSSLSSAIPLKFFLTSANAERQPRRREPFLIRSNQLSFHSFSRRETGRCGARSARQRSPAK